MATQAQLRANANYRKHNVKTVAVPFYPKDKELYEWLCLQPKKAEYIRELIRRDKEAKESAHQ